jgi:hypothetical protein
MAFQEGTYPEVTSMRRESLPSTGSNPEHFSAGRANPISEFSTSSQQNFAWPEILATRAFQPLDSGNDLHRSPSSAHDAQWSLDGIQISADVVQCLFEESVSQCPSIVPARFLPTPDFSHITIRSCHFWIPRNPRVATTAYLPFSTGPSLRLRLVAILQI